MKLAILSFVERVEAEWETRVRKHPEASLLVSNQAGEMLPVSGRLGDRDRKRL